MNFKPQLASDAVIEQVNFPTILQPKTDGVRGLNQHGKFTGRSMDEFDGWVRHEGEEFLYVLTGVIRLYTEFYEPAELRRGDSAYYDATMGHNVISLSDEDATLLWVTSLA